MCAIQLVQPQPTYLQTLALGVQSQLVNYHKWVMNIPTLWCIIWVEPCNTVTNIYIYIFIILWIIDVPELTDWLFVPQAIQPYVCPEEPLSNTCLAEGRVVTPTQGTTIRDFSQGKIKNMRSYHVLSSHIKAQRNVTINSKFYALTKYIPAWKIFPEASWCVVVLIWCRGFLAGGQSLLNIIPQVDSLTNCSFVYDTFNTIVNERCSPARRAIRNLWIPLLLLSIALTLITISWILANHRNKKERYSHTIHAQDSPRPTQKWKSPLESVNFGCSDLIWYASTFI